MIRKSLLITVIIHLFLILITLIVDHVEESQFVDALAGRHNTEPVTELLLLKELLCPVLFRQYFVRECNLDVNVQVLQVAA